MPTNPATDELVPQRVRDINPQNLLMYGTGDGVLQPYLPRDVDEELDEALASPGVVLLVHETAAGTRRTAYEALRRNLPDAALIVDPDLNTLREDEPLADAVLWLDRALSLDTIHRTDSGTLQGWLRSRARRWVLAIVSAAATEPEIRDAFEGLHPRVVRMSQRLTSREQETVSQRYPGADGVDTVERFLDEVAGREQVPEAKSRRNARTARDTRVQHAADYRADTDEGVDRLGITTDVRMLADIVASRLIEPPLSIGLFGNWGSGKSFFMRQMRERVRTLAEAAQAAEQQAGTHDRAVSSYCSSVRQITFNAWHYTEANLWASLATYIFDNLASDGSENDLQRRADDLAQRRQKEESLLGQLSAVRLERMLLTAQQEQRAARRQTPGDVARALLRGLTREDRSWIAAELGVPEPTAEDVRRFADEVIGLHAETRSLWRWLRRDPVPGLVLVSGLLVVGLLRFLVGWTGWSGLVGGLTLIGTVATAVARVRATVSRIRKVADKLDAPDERAAATIRRLAELDKEAEGLERAVAELAPGHDVTAFVESRSGSQDYRQHLGVVSLLRRDLETFAAMLARERDRFGGSAGVERIVLYIDDLDRCPPRVVIQVLEAIHLLLALPVFVVVVGVDARWLTRAIRQHYATMLDGATTRQADDDALAANYLEKIFQVPLVLSPMGEDGFAALVRGLAEGDEPGSEDESGLDFMPTALITSEFPGGDGTKPTRRSAPATTGHPPGHTVEQPTLIAAPAPSVELRPRRLAVSQAELTFLATLAPLVSSPRAAKRLVNLYRLLRARFSGTELDEFLAPGIREAPHRAVLVLLAVLVGHSDTAPLLFSAIANAEPEETLQALLNRFGGDPALSGKLAGLGTGDSELVPPALVGSYQRWVPLVSRFSFTVT